VVSQLVVSRIVLTSLELVSDMLTKQKKEYQEVRIFHVLELVWTYFNL
jgi:hypothetical protein